MWQSGKEHININIGRETFKVHDDIMVKIIASSISEICCKETPAILYNANDIVLVHINIRISKVHLCSLGLLNSRPLTLLNIKSRKNDIHALLLIVDRKLLDADSVLILDPW